MKARILGTGSRLIILVHCPYRGPSSTDRLRISHWSPFDPVVMRLDTCEHWSKMKVKAVVAAEAKRAAASGKTRRCDPSSGEACEVLKFRDLCVPVPTQKSTRPCVSAKPSALMTEYSQRAKEGFQYWYRERPKPTSCKYGSDWGLLSYVGRNRRTADLRSTCTACRSRGTTRRSGRALCVDARSRRDASRHGRPQRVVPPGQAGARPMPGDVGVPLARSADGSAAETASPALTSRDDNIVYWRSLVKSTTQRHDVPNVY
ncbi:hypothetical protein NP493_95g03017 [Ridgeia piscesae]|uniref:Uncharacterized protein n=1 Tax=Ridgeia piscesae TaxID=27915 RepID=A0AAD9P852_RIDPI|nr:hypothetical protein NP493_95g03017 [Ridgeia piscesae]